MDNYSVYNTSAFVSSGLSIVLNSILVILITKRTTKDVKAYCHVLLQGCMVDTITAVILALTVPQIEASDVRFYFRTSTPWYPDYGMYPCIAAWSYMSCLSTVLWSMIIQAFFRYFIIVKRFTPRGASTWILQFIFLFFGMFIALPYLIIPCRNINLSDNDPLKDMDLWRDYPALLNTFRSIHLLNFWFLTYIILLFTLTLVANIAFIYSNLKVAKTLNSSKSHFSVQTLRIHRQFGRRIILQSITPCCSFIVLIVVFSLMFAVPAQFAQEQGGYLLVALMPLQYIIVFNPLITLLSIKSYRKALFCCSNKVNNSSVPQIKSTTLKVSSMVKLT